MRRALFTVVTVLSTALFSTLGILFGLLRVGPKGFDWIHRSWGRILLRAAGARLEVEGLGHVVPGRPQILVANHQSMLDIWSLMVAVPTSVRFVAKAELSRIPLFAAATRAAGHVFIDRGKASSAAEAIREGIARMHRDGLTLVLFPEGTRSGEDGRLGRFLRGSFALAIETQAHLIPAAIEGGRHVLPRDARGPRPGRISIRFAPAVPLAGAGSADRDRLLEETRATIAGLLEELRGPDPDAA